MAHHRLKIWPEHFRAVVSGHKRSELRVDDRSPAFDRGDTIGLEEYDPIVHSLTGSSTLVRVTHVNRGGVVPQGLAMLSIIGLQIGSDHTHQVQNMVGF